MVLPCSMCFNFQVAANSQNMNLVCLIIFDYYYSSEIRQPSHSWSGQPQFVKLYIHHYITFIVLEYSKTFFSIYLHLLLFTAGQPGEHSLSQERSMLLTRTASSGSLRG